MLLFSGPSGDVVAEYCAEVGLLTRNILVQGNQDPAWETEIEACPEGFNPGGAQNY